MSKKKCFFFFFGDFFYHTKSDTIQERCIPKWRAETAECPQCRKNSHIHTHRHTHTHKHTHGTHTPIDIHYNINNVSAGKWISFWLFFWPNTVKLEWWGEDQSFDIIFIFLNLSFIFITYLWKFMDMHVFGLKYSINLYFFYKILFLQCFYIYLKALRYIWKLNEASKWCSFQDLTL